MKKPTRDELLLENQKLKAQNELLIQLVGKRNDADAHVGGSESSLFRDLTMKQNAALQMVLAGRGNQAIADTLDCSLSTAKIHVKGIMRRLDVNTRAQLCLRVKPWYDSMDESTYENVTGLPKDWYEDPKTHEVTELLTTKTR